MTDCTPNQLADELREALDDPGRNDWGGYPWEHLGDAERDVRVLLAERRRHRAIEAAALTVVEVNEGGPRMYDVSDWNEAIHDLRAALEHDD